MSKFLLLFEFFLIGVMFPSFSIAQNYGLREVVIEGKGRDVAEAAQNAAQNALTNVVGSFIDGKTELEKKVQIQDGVRNQTKNIKVDIKEYSQGSIQRFEILNTSNAGNLVTVVAKVTVRFDDFKSYIRKIAESDIKLNEGLFAQIKVEEKQNKNAAGLIYDRIITPLITGEAVDFFISTPRPLSQMGIINTFLYQLDIPRLQQQPDSSVVGFTVDVKPKAGYLANIKNILNAVAAYKISMGQTSLLRDGQVNEFYSFKVAYPPKYEYQKDFALILAEDEIGATNYVTFAEQRSKSLQSLTAYVIKDSKIDFAKASDWTACLMRVNCRSSEFHQSHPTPFKTLQLEILDGGGNILQSEKIGDGMEFDPNRVKSQNNRMLVLGNQSEFFSSQWALAGAKYQNSEALLIRNSNKFIVLLAVRESALKNAKSVVLKLVD